jgi:nitric oxide reductase subunit C
MTWVLTREHARIIFFSGAVFFCCLFLALAFETLLEWSQHGKPVAIDQNTQLEDRVAFGKSLWEKYNCVGCHTLIGEGAYFAPELGNVYQRYNGNTITLKNLIKHRPEGNIPAYRAVPKFYFTEDELNALVEFLQYSSKINTAHWPPYKEG